VAFQISWYHSSDHSAPHRGFRQLKLAESVTVGREDGADILLKDKAVSRLHAEIYVDGGGVHIRDRNSSNGIRIDGKRINEAIWVPGQKLAVGPFVLELAPSSAGTSPDIVVPSHKPSIAPSRLAEPSPGGRVELGDVFVRARQNDKHAVHELFSGFLGRTEQMIDCGYLGALGFIFPEYSFWAVTNSRVCGLLINHGGWMNFNFGFTKSLNRALFVQPSMVTLWITLILWVIGTVLVSLSMFIWVWYAIYYSTLSSVLAWFLGIIVLFVVAGCGVLLIPWVVRAYYRWVKAGCIFWTQELVPIVIPADRHSLRDAQRFISVFTDQKRMLGD
jgi:pSer/pThr/pTyr-binding forkhead associated (FHA) protein